MGVLVRIGLTNMRLKILETYERSVGRYVTCPQCGYNNVISTHQIWHRGLIVGYSRNMFRYEEIHQLVKSIQRCGICPWGMEYMHSTPEIFEEPGVLQDLL